MLNDDERHIPVKLRCGGRAKFAEGGLAHAANAVADAGRFGDELVVHINRREFEEMRQKWGDPHVNPETGLPEFWSLDDAWDSVKDYVAPVGAAVAGAFMPVIGETIGTYLPSVAGVLGETGTQALGAGLLGAGAGALINGGEGALWGGLGGVAGAYGGDFLQNGASSALGSALGSTAAAAAGTAAGGAGGAGSVSSPVYGALGATPGLNSNALSGALLMSALNLGANALGSNGQSKATKKNKKAFDEAQAEFNKPLPVYTNPRTPIQYASGDMPDYTTQGERIYFNNNNFADGGAVGYAKGGNADDGRSDKIEALLSPGEFVMDAETVALLGNGNTEAGAAQLNRLRANIRRHKGSALAAGAISPDALPPEQYI